jgi:hypothetical protein
MNILTADYLIVGAGAMGMAFTDTLISETDASVVMVDRHHQPGGHWNDAYPFVRLHQPSAFYGVNSKPLGSDCIDATGWNQGLFELATNSEVCAYFDQVMHQQFLPSGRVQYLPMHEYHGDQRMTSLVSGEATLVDATKVVDSTYMNVTVPSIRPPAYGIGDGVACEPPNALPSAAGQFDRYVIVGAGKTGMDACLFLLKNGADPDSICWIMPRDSWLLDRANIQPLPDSLGKQFAAQAEATAGATTFDDLFERLNTCGALLRFDDTVKPTMYRCATVTKLELEQLRRIKSIVRMGHVERIDRDEIVLDQGPIPTNERTLHVDCTADGLERRPVLPVFAGNNITLQSVRTCQQVFSAAFIGHVEASYDDDQVKNELCGVVPHPDDDVDYLRTTLAAGRNAARWAQDEGLRAWLRHSRLDGFSRADDPVAPFDTELAQQMADTQKASVATLERLLAEIDEA